MLWIKALHIIFVVAWFAGLFYLPRLFVYHCTIEASPEHERFVVMERRLLGIMTIGGIAALGFGLALLPWWSGALGGGSLWLHVKLLLVAALIAFHVYCAVLVRRFRDGENRHSERYFRLINEFPAVVLVAVVILVVVKPF